MYPFMLCSSNRGVYIHGENLRQSFGDEPEEAEKQEIIPALLTRGMVKILWC